MHNQENEAELADRRKFLASCGKFAVVTPPAITMLLSTSLTSDAIAATGGTSFRPNNGFGNGPGDGVPNPQNPKFTNSDTVR
jgi:hypothetical protein